MKTFTVTVRAPGNPPFTANVSAADEGKARTRAMMSYPHVLRGKLVDYDVAELPDVPQWQREFPDYPADGMPALPASWSDTSWHNDSAPSFLISDRLLIWIDYPDAALSEFADARRDGTCKRFVLSRMVDGQHVDTGDDALGQSDSWHEILQMVAKLESTQ